MSTRKIIDPKQNGEKVWLKGHAQAIYMSDGSTVEDAINSIQGGSGGIIVETDPVFSSSPAASITANNISNWNNKQDTISDIDNIRTGSVKGATAVQPSSLAVVATSGNYNDLTNKPTIPASVTESTVSGWGFTKNTGTYSKPSTGIPVSDLAGDIQTALGKANTALQSYTEQYKGTITGVSANGTSIATSGVANIPAASTSKYGVTKLTTLTNSSSTTLAATASAVKVAYDLANSKQEKLTSGTNIKTVNGESILGSGDLVIGGGNVQAVDTGDVIDDVTVNYATKTYVDGLVGDINSILESIINGGGNVSIFPITLTIGDNGQSAIDLYNYVTQNHANGVYSFKENEIVKYDSEIIAHFNFNYANASIINTYLDNGYVLVVNQSGVVSVDTGAGN